MFILTPMPPTFAPTPILVGLILEDTPTFIPSPEFERTWREGGGGPLRFISTDGEGTFILTFMEGLL